MPVSLAIGVWWLRRKIAFQQAGLPYLYRLADSPQHLPDPAPVQRLIDPAVTPIYRHLLVSSPFGAGKTGLAAGISTEFSFRISIERYTTLVKLLESNERSVDRSGQEFQNGRMLWPWRNAELLVIDDVDTVGDMLVGRVMPEGLRGLGRGSGRCRVGYDVGRGLQGRIF